MSQNNFDDKNKQQSTIAKRHNEIEIRKARQALINATTEEKEEIFKKVHLEREVQLPRTFKEKLNNFWYHNRLISLLVIALVFVFVFIVYDVTNREEYDLTISAITTQGNTTSQIKINEFQEQIKEYITDIDLNGKTNVLFCDYRIGDNINPLIIQANITRYKLSLQNPEDLVYIVNEEVYNLCKEEGIVFENLTKYSDNPKIDNDRYSLKDDARFKSINDYEDMYIVVKDITSMKNLSKDIIKKYNDTINFVKQILN